MSPPPKSKLPFAIILSLILNILSWVAINSALQTREEEKELLIITEAKQQEQQALQQPPAENKQDEFVFDCPPVEIIDALIESSLKSDVASEATAVELAVITDDEATIDGETEQRNTTDSQLQQTSAQGGAEASVAFEPVQQRQEQQPTEQQEQQEEKQEQIDSSTPTEQTDEFEDKETKNAMTADAYEQNENAEIKVQEVIDDTEIPESFEALLAQRKQETTPPVVEPIFKQQPTPASNDSTEGAAASDVNVKYESVGLGAKISNVPQFKLQKHEYGEYLRAAMKHLEISWRTEAYSAKLSGKRGSVILVLQISPDGSILNYNLHKDDEELVMEANLIHAALRKASVFQKFPDTIDEKYLEFVVRFIY